MLVREKLRQQHLSVYLSWATVGCVQSPGMAQGREFQVHQVLKHLTVVSKLSGFKVPT
jgi:hypothetical protein